MKTIDDVKKEIKNRMDAYSHGYAKNDDARFEALELLLTEINRWNENN